ncbi:relaxase/mobilization nuclease domain-containing protein [Bradyrhizobium sp. 930_D9_N1_4]|uniref:relaxase/mobilization nuclease domain-containing protein n=1 Tax=Bradyrhizobium sp. 930_D9_N1_4 TaxID=3240374 RepID=UPI003F8C9B46
MIVNIGEGTSFVGISKYLMHDKEAQTSERVAWTHTRNLANDFVPSAVDEMIWTSRNAELLKQEAGVRGGGRASEYSVKHVSLNWAESDNPSQQHMIATAEHFLQWMGWDEHQVIMVAHNDKQYKHVHLIINQTHPETGRHLNHGFDQRRAQKWAGAYEVAQGQIHCTQRQLDPALREQNMPRNMWMAFKQNEADFLKSEEQLREKDKIPEYRPEIRISDEWEIFKQIQKDQRQQFYADGKKQFKELRSNIYREIRHEFRERWADYYKADKKTVGDDRRLLKPVKDQLLADQAKRLKDRGDKLFAELKQSRQVERDALKIQQGVDRAEFRTRLAAGIDNSDFFARLVNRDAITPKPIVKQFRDAALQTTAHHEARPGVARGPAADDMRQEREPREVNARQRDLGDGARRQLANVAGSFFDALFEVVTFSAANETRGAPRNIRDALEIAAEEATKRVQEERAQEETQTIKRSRTIYGE